MLSSARYDMYRHHRELISPLDAFNAIPREPEREVVPSYESISARTPFRESISPSPTSPKSTISKHLWSSDVGKQQVSEESLQTQIKGSRRYSDQVLQIRSTPSHSSSASYPFLALSQTSNYYSTTTHYQAWDAGAEMELQRLNSRPVSLASSQYSFKSKHRSPLSVSSSIDYESSRTSVDSTYSAPKQNDLLPLRTPMPPVKLIGGKRSFTEPIVPAYARYGIEGHGRQHMQMGSTTSQKLSRGLPNPTGVKYKARIPGEGFKKLPKEILLVILGELKKLHLDVGSLSCSTCWMRDLTNLGLSCRKWWSAARCALYEDIQLNGTDSIIHTKKRFKIKYGTRIRLLRRTLRSRPDLAAYVKCLKVPAMPDGLKTKKEQDEYVDMCASLIMACPNLERFPGFYPSYRHEFSPIVHALSTRQKLTERIWVIDASPFQRQRRYNFDQDSELLTQILAPGQLLPEQCIELLTYHMRWQHLHTLFLHCNAGGTIDSLLFSDIFNSLPSLEHLHVSSFPAPSFNDSTLTCLPSLRSLRLEKLPGVSATGLSNYVAATCSDALTHLSLISVPLLSLPVLARLFSHLVSMTHFTISQEASPALPIGVEIFLHPYLASESLQYLHWELTNPDDDVATSVLGNSIRFNGFPALRTIRAPTDFQGTLQKLCKPRDRIELPGDRYRNTGTPSSFGIPHTQSLPNMPPSPARSTFSLGHHQKTSIASNFYAKSPSRSTFSLKMDRSSSVSHPIALIDDESSYSALSLVTARRLAQARIDAAATQPKFHIIIWDEDGQFVERYAVGGFMGDMSSQIFYSLKADVDGTDVAVVRVDGLGGLLDGADEKRFKDGCTGSWNLDVIGDGRGKRGGGRERWWHTERGRWREVALERFF